MSSTQPPNGNPDATAANPEASLKTTPAGTGTDATIGRFRDAVESLKDAAPSAESPTELAAESSADSADRSARPLKCVVAEQFVLVDSHGERRASLSLDGDGSPSLTLSDASGRARGGSTGRRWCAVGRPL
jgi:hypothetical protein